MRWLFVRHSPRAFAYNIEATLLARGDSIDELRFAEGPRPADPRFYDAVVFFGGYMYAGEDAAHPWIRDELAYMEAAMKAGRPLLGVCLGGQLLARLLGARVYRAEVPEFGYWNISLTEEGKSSPLFAGFGERFRAFLWHDEAFDLPSGASRLAMGAHCPNQAFCYGGLSFGLQFHLEFSADQIRSMVMADASSIPRRSAAWQEPMAVYGDDGSHAEASRSMLAMMGNLAALAGGRG